jgi:hypothetical protein
MAVGIGLAIAAWAPLVIYVVVEKMRGRTGGNPIGLGLLAWLGTAVGLLLLIGGAIADSRARS